MNALASTPLGTYFSPGFVEGRLCYAMYFRSVTGTLDVVCEGVAELEDAVTAPETDWENRLLPFLDRALPTPSVNTKEVELVCRQWYPSNRRR